MSVVTSHINQDVSDCIAISPWSPSRQSHGIIHTTLKIRRQHCPGSVPLSMFIACKKWKDVLSRSNLFVQVFGKCGTSLLWASKPCSLAKAHFASSSGPFGAALAFAFAFGAGGSLDSADGTVVAMLTWTWLVMANMLQWQSFSLHVPGQAWHDHAPKFPLPAWCHAMFHGSLCKQLHRSVERFQPWYS